MEAAKVDRMREELEAQMRAKVEAEMEAVMEAQRAEVEQHREMSALLQARCAR